jgi:signal peptidase I
MDLPDSLKPPSASPGHRNKLLIGMVFIPSAMFVVLLLLRVSGQLMWCFVPTGGMAPALAPGDHVLMEGLSLWVREPCRGDIVMFKTDYIPSLPPSRRFVMRVAGEPGDRLRISDGKLYINDNPVTLSNLAGEITYHLPPGAEHSSLKTEATVTEDGYFLLGDNSENSADSRFWGCVPRGNIMGRVVFCYWPLDRIGPVK